MPYAHWSDEENISVYEAEGDVIAFDNYDKVVCSRARLLRLVENPFSENNIGNNNSGYCNSGDYNSGNHNTGSFNSGNYNSGKLNTGNWNSGNRNTGNWNSGDYNTGNWNSGDYNIGNWNSGNRNYGYFCTISNSNKIFNISIPENWEPKFPKWIYFDLLPKRIFCILAKSI